MSELYIVAGVTAKPGKEEQLKKDLVALVEPSRREEGNLRYDLYEDMNSPGRFVFVEQWESAEAQSRHHNNGAHIKRFHENGERNIEKREFVHLLKRVI